MYANTFTYTNIFIHNYFSCQSSKSLHCSWKVTNVCLRCLTGSKLILCKHWSWLESPQTEYSFQCHSDQVVVSIILHITMQHLWFHQSHHLFFRQWSWPAPVPSFLMNTTPSLSVSQNLLSTKERTWVSRQLQTGVESGLWSFYNFII